MRKRIIVVVKKGLKEDCELIESEEMIEKWSLKGIEEREEGLRNIEREIIKNKIKGDMVLRDKRMKDENKLIEGEGKKLKILVEIIENWRRKIINEMRKNWMI